MFSPRHAPLKEGRSHPGLLYANAPRRASTQRYAVVFLLVLLCCPLAYLIVYSDSAVSIDTRSKFQSAVERSKVSVAGAKVVLERDVASDVTGQPPRRTSAPRGKARVVETYDEGAAEAAKEVRELKLQKPVIDSDSIPARPNDHAAKSPATSNIKVHSSVDTWSERPSFEKALSNVISMLPDEVHMRELTRDIEGTGKEKLREMGLRTRAYKKYFEAWEALHLTTDEEGGTYVRDDVVQYLRSHKHVPDIENDSAEEIFAGKSIPQAIRSYEAYRAFLAKFAHLLFPYPAPYFSDHMSLHAHFKRGGKGIVLTAGDDQAPFLLVTIPTFRKLGCDLPIEIMYLGDSDLSEDYRQDLEALGGVTTRDIAQMVRDDGWKLAGWAAKPFAILFSSFREVIFIDADSLFFTNPAVLFEEPAYQETGALFFRDRLIMPESKKRWLQQILPKPISKQVRQSRFWTGTSGHMQESGVVVVDKWKHFIAMLLVTRMNGPDRDGNQDDGRIGVYDMVYGDKETFWIGWELVGDQGYAFHQGDAGIMGVVRKPEEFDMRANMKRMPMPFPFNTLGQEDAGQAKDEKAAADPVPGPADNETEASAPPPPPDNYTICAPQLLHLTTTGKPLWFNGWLLDNKFADKQRKTFQKFESYLIEPRDVREPGAWQLGESNMCCLTSDAGLRREFTREETAVLEMIMQVAQDQGDISKGGD